MISEFKGLVAIGLISLAATGGCSSPDKMHTYSVAVDAVVADKDSRELEVVTTLPVAATLKRVEIVEQSPTRISLRAVMETPNENSNALPKRGTMVVEIKSPLGARTVYDVFLETGVRVVAPVS